MKSRALFVCCTPLQVLIAKNIISIQKDHSFDLILISPHLNQKYLCAYNKSKAIFEEQILIEIKNKINLLKKEDRNLFNNAYKRIHDFVVNKNYDSIFIANIDKKIILKLISNFHFKTIISFDDGIENLNIKNGLLYKTEKKNLSNFLFRLNGIKFSREGLRNLISHHYTIYPNHENLSKNLIPITLKNEYLYDPKDQLLFPFKDKDSISILLGTPPDEEKKDSLNTDYKTICKHIVEKFKIDYYYPHPRETSTIDFVNTITYPDIFEDFILNLNYLNKELKIKIYSFGSSTHLNLIALKNIQHTVINRKGKEINYEILKIFSFYNIEIVNL